MIQSKPNYDWHRFITVKSNRDFLLQMLIKNFCACLPQKTLTQLRSEGYSSFNINILDKRFPEKFIIAKVANALRQSYN